MEISKADATLETLILAKGLTAPRLTPADIQAKIAGVTYTMMPSGRCMICEMTLVDGATVYGFSIVGSEDNFDVKIGEEVSYNDARDEVWSYEGKKLRERIVAERRASNEETAVIS